jgi:AcrR family transcriptional regulator
MTSGGEDTPPPSRPPAFRKRKKLRKEEIVAEATRLFAERGYEGTSMGDLAECVGLRKASLFHHFESKDTLYATVLSQLVDGVQGAILRVRTADGSFVDRLDALSDAITGLLGEQPHAARLLIREAMDWGPVMRDQLAERIRVMMAAAVEFARAGQREGVFNPSLDPNHLIISLAGIYFIPFLIDRTVEGFTGQSPFGPPFIDERQRSVREQIRLIALNHSKA